MPFRDDHAGSMQIIAVMIAGFIFLGSIGAVLFATRTMGTQDDAADAAATKVEAGGLADVLVSSNGVGWASGADHITRLGLMATNGSGLQQSSIDALRGALEDSTANGKVDYEDARLGLGISANSTQDFHISVYPVGMSTLYNASLSGIRTAYIADWASLSSVTLALGTPQSQYAAQANVKLNLSMSTGTYEEREALRVLGLGFNNRVYVSTLGPSVLVDLAFPLPDTEILTLLNVPLLEGDVYPDQKQYLDNNLPNRLSQYEMLIVGSEVDQSALTSNAVKSAVASWVLNGGTLVVLGSANQNFQWLQPLFQTGVSTVNGAPSAPDVQHPLLKQPHDLAWTSYNTHGYAWDIKDTGSGAHYTDFSHVIVQGTTNEDVLAVSKDGAFGEGRVILSSYMPKEFGSIGANESRFFFENLALYADRSDLYVEYGPEMPQDEQVSVAVRDSWLWDEELGQVPVRVEVYTWS